MQSVFGEPTGRSLYVRWCLQRSVLCRSCSELPLRPETSRCFGSSFLSLISLRSVAANGRFVSMRFACAHEAIGRGGMVVRGPVQAHARYVRCRARREPGFALQALHTIVCHLEPKLQARGLSRTARLGPDDSVCAACAVTQCRCSFGTCWTCTARWHRRASMARLSSAALSSAQVPHTALRGSTLRSPTAPKAGVSTKRWWRVQAVDT